MDHQEHIRELERSFDRSEDKDFKLGGKSFRLRPENSFSRYIIKGVAVLTLGAALAYTGYKIVNSGSKIIEKWTDKISIFYQEE